MIRDHSTRIMVNFFAMRNTKKARWTTGRRHFFIYRDENIFTKVAYLFYNIEVLGKHIYHETMA